MIDRSSFAPSLEQMAAAANLSRFHFHRTFKAYTGITPHAYLAEARIRRTQHELAHAETISEAIHRAGFSSNAQFYSSSSDMLGMTPTEFRAGGKNTVLRFTIRDCSLGPVLTAFAPKGTCAIWVGGNATELHGRLSTLFPQAELIEADSSAAALVTSILRRAELPGPDAQLLPHHVQRIALSSRVRHALRREWGRHPVSVLRDSFFTIGESELAEDRG